MKCPKCNKNEAIWSEHLKSYILCSNCQIIDNSLNEDLLKKTGIPAHYRDADLIKDFPNNIVKKIYEGTNKFNKNIVLYGNTFKGKTYFICSLLIYKLKKEPNISCFFTNYSLLLENIRNGFSDGSTKDYFKFLYEVDYLAIDDVGVEKTNDFTYETFYKIINTRYENDKTTYITLNCNSPQDVLDERILWRLSDNGAIFKFNKNYKKGIL